MSLDREALVAGLERLGPAMERDAPLLNEADLREDARCVLTLLPGEAPVAAMQAALALAPEDFKPSLAQGLRARGVEVPGIPCQKLVPTRETDVRV